MRGEHPADRMPRAWPRYMTARVAADYADTSAWTIRRHVPPCGRRGRSFVYAIEDVERFFDRVSTAWAPVPGTVDLLRRLRVRGHRLFCLSNMHPASWSYLERSCDFWELFAGIAISCHVRLIKPEPAIYAHLLARYGLDGSRTVFIDDRDVNLVAAAFFGIQTIKFETPAQCETRLRALGCL